MKETEFQILKNDDEEAIGLIAQWYNTEWQIPVVQTISRLKSMTDQDRQFQILLRIDGEVVATAGVYNEVGIFAIAPNLKLFKNWLALVYTVPMHRKKGYASLLCLHMEEHALTIGITQLYLFTHTAESMYRTLGWQAFQQIPHQDKMIAVMRKPLVID